MDLRERLEQLVRQELNRRGLSRMYPTVMFRGAKICFRLSDPRTKGISKWSRWLSEEDVSLEYPEPVLDHVKALLVYLGYAPDVVEEETESAQDETPSFDDLMEILRRLPVKAGGLPRGSPVTGRSSVAFPVKKAAQYLGISPNTLRKRSDEGLIPARRDHNGHRVFLRSELDQYLDSLPPYVPTRYPRNERFAGAGRLKKGGKK